MATSDEYFVKSVVMATKRATFKSIAITTWLEHFVKSIAMATKQLQLIKSS